MSKLNSNVGTCKIKEAMRKEGGRVHFIGVGGVGMYPLFRLTESLGIRVSGSDSASSRLTELLIGEGKRISIGHRKENADGADLIVYTLAVSDSNPEILRGEELSIPTVSRAEYLGALMEEYKERIGVSGTHGKSTTTAMIDKVFHEAEKEPTTVLGALIPGTAEPIRTGKRDFLIYEACEYKDSFLKFSPTASVFTNLELDHVDYFKDLDSIKESFLRAMDATPLVIVNSDDKNLASLSERTKAKCISYGTKEGADYRVSEIDSNGGFYSFKIRHDGCEAANISLKIPGKFNVMNAAAAAVLCLEFGVDGKTVEGALSNFGGIGRRLEHIGKFKNTEIYYDYAHHPTEIECTIRAVKEMHPGRLAVIFKPHTYSRTAAFIEEFANALSLADAVFVCEVDGVREENLHGVRSDTLVSKIGSVAKYISDEGSVSSFLEGFESSIIMGAANLDTVKRGIFGK